MGTTNSLPSFGGDSGYTTVSGWSGGSHMATNLHVIYSETIKGIGIVNGGPYAIGEYKDIAGIF
jgi:poly(3-hydroxybutyrate) depolymerase